MFYRGINYITFQRKHDTCVAISIVNALKWSGRAATEKDVMYIHRHVWKKDTYTKISNIRSVLNRAKRHFTFTYKKHPSLASIREFLQDNDKAIIFSHFTSNQKNVEEGHSVFVLGHDANHVCIMNYESKKRIMSYRKFARLLKKTHCYPDVFYLEKTK